MSFFKNNIIYTNKLKLIRKYKKHIDKLNISKYINNIKDLKQLSLIILSLQN